MVLILVIRFYLAIKQQVWFCKSQHTPKSTLVKILRFIMYNSGPVYLLLISAKGQGFTFYSVSGLIKQQCLVRK